MKKIFATAVATAMIAATSVAVTSAPASAGSFNFSLGLYAPVSPYYGGYYAPAPVYPVAPVGNWQAHVAYCYSKYPNSYNPNTNTWKGFNGVTYICHSPYWG